MTAKELTSEQVEFLKEGIKTLPTRKLAETFTDAFGIYLCQTELRRVCEKYEIKNPRKEYSQLPIGYERYSEYYDCIVVKVSDVSVSGANKKDYAKLRQNNWKFKQNLIWEQTHGRKLGWREIVMFLDGDRTNYDPDNLYAVPMNVAGSIKRMDMMSEDAEINKTALMWGQLYYMLPQQTREKIKEREKQCR